MTAVGMTLMHASVEAFPRDEETADLLRQATIYGDAGQWDAAVECLYQANARMWTSPVMYPILSWLRLPLYLQKAGRYEDATREFDKLHAETPARIARLSEPGSKALRRRQIARDQEVIQQKRELAQRREAKGRLALGTYTRQASEKKLNGKVLTDAETKVQFPEFPCDRIDC